VEETLELPDCRFCGSTYDACMARAFSYPRWCCPNCIRDGGHTARRKSERVKDYNAPTNRTLRWYRRTKHTVKDALSTLAHLAESLGAR
jgi:hypothetical protein